MTRLALVAFAALSFSGCKTETRACSKLKSLCGTDAETCRDLRTQTQESFGQDALDTLDGCVLQSSSCSEALGCSAGAATKAAVGAMKDFAKGFQKGAEEPKP